MLTVFPDSDRVPNPWLSCAFPPQKNRLLAGKISLVPGAGEPVTSQARGRGHYAAVSTNQIGATHLVSGTGIGSEQRGMFWRLFLGEKKETVWVTRQNGCESVNHGRIARQQTGHKCILPSLLLLTKVRLSSYTLKIKNNQVLTLSISVLCIEAECSDGKMSSLIQK